MIRCGTGKSVFAVLAMLSWPVPSNCAPTTGRVNGSIAGIVRDDLGVPQMGATVLLFNRFEKLIQRSLTNERGAFGFDPLTPDVYSVRVSLSSFVPAMKHQITVQPGMQSLLAINMATLLSSIELVYAAPGQGALMSDDWKWTLKTAVSSRPVLRILPQISISDPNTRQHTVGAIFSETRGILRVSAGDPGSSGDSSQEPDLGTAFALATSIFGHRHLQVSGNFAHAAGTALPATSFRTSYSQESGGGPEVSITMRQVYLPTHAGAALVTGQTDGLPAIRTLSVAMIDRLHVTDNLLLEYGSSLDSVSFIEHLNYFSPFARLTYDLNLFGTVRAAYSSGAPPVELFSKSGETETSLHQDLASLALTPRVSLRGRRAEVQRTQSFEIAYEKKFHNRSLHASAYRELVSNGALTVFGGDEASLAGEILPNLSSSSSTFNIGSYQRYGYMTSATQSIGSQVEIAASVGRSGALAADTAPLNSTSGDEIRSRIHMSQRYWASARVSATVPRAGTQISTSYQWTDYNSILPSHLSLTQNSEPDSGWNIHIRQPIPGLPGMPGRVEATADLRNITAQGYAAFAAPDGQRILLMQAPRAVRGGLSFIF